MHLTHEEGVAREIKRLNAYNSPIPDHCPKCGGELASGSGYVGEEILYCTKGCGIVWEDSEGAIRRVL